MSRNGWPWLTLALVLDGDGFPKASRVFPGNVSEPSTLLTMLQTLRGEMASGPSLSQTTPTVVIDAGIASAANLAAIQEAGFSYIAVSRSRPQEVPQEDMVVIKETNATTIQVQRLTQDGEMILCCHSSARARQGIERQTRMEKRFAEGLEKLVAGLTKPRGCKSYGKIMARLGRLRERYPTIAQFYDIEVEHRDGQVSCLTWEVAQPEQLQNRFSGAYYLRSNRHYLNDAEIWSLYKMLNHVEDAFRSLKSELGLRPVYHRLDHRLEGHLFISILAYHLLAIIQRRLRQKGLSYRWQTIRTRLATQMRVTVAITNDNGERLYIPQSTDPEPSHLEIYQPWACRPNCSKPNDCEFSKM
jgi:transposase